WTDRPRRHPQIKSDINYRIHRLFSEAGIEIPFPQSELRLRGTVPEEMDVRNLLPPEEHENEPAYKEK
ncbi:MAG: hypothetical protein LC672_06395, partial [Acidobacteria bacterium]|nr:hypothetical protein [Acidobacteriota bacterium]